MFTLKEIKGAVVEKKPEYNYPHPHYCDGQCKCDQDGKDFNSAIDVQSSIQLQFNREKLAKTMYCVKGTSYDWGILDQETKDNYFRVADAIIASDKEIIEVKP